MGFVSADIYKHYKEQGGELSYKTWAAICQDYNQRAMDEIILQGGVLNMGNNLSTLSIGRIPRNPANKQVDWKESYKLRDQLLEEGKKLYDKKTGEGHKWLVYFTNKFYCRFYWHKNKCKIPNKSVYQFKATRGKMGNKRKLKELLRGDELAYLRFRKLRD